MSKNITETENRGFSNSWDFSISQEFNALVKTVKPVSKKPVSLGVFLPMSNDKGLILVARNSAKTGYSKREYFNGIKKEAGKN
jgi:ureidoglycolate hydrolase